MSHQSKAIIVTNKVGLNPNKIQIAQNFTKICIFHKRWLNFGENVMAVKS